MDIGAIQKKTSDFIKKYKYAALVLVIGLGLMLLPGKTQKSGESVSVPVQTQENQTSVSQELARILTSIEGVGKVEVMLTVATGPQTVYQTDNTLSQSANESTSRKDTVIITDSNRNELALVVQVIPEKYQGAVIVCQGASSPSVHLAVVEAVAKVTGLSSDRISVLKMK